MDITRKINLLGMGAALLSNCIFGFTFVLVKYILNTGMSPYALLAWRLIIATLLMLLLAACGVFHMDFRGKKILKLLPVGMCEPCLYFICESIGIGRTTAAESGTIIALIPIWVLILTRLLFKERHTRGQMAGVLISVTGIICVVLSGGTSASFSLSGYLCLFGAVMIAGFYNMGVRWLAAEFNAAELIFGTNVLGLVFFTAITCTEGLFTGNMSAVWLLPLHNTRVLLYILLLSAGASVGAFMLIVYAINSIGPTRASIFAGVNTLVSIIFSLLMLGERLQTWQLFGAAMIIAGVWSANYFVAPPEAKAAAGGG